MQGRNAQQVWQQNRVGPYRLVRRLKGVSTAECVGRVYTAYHAPSGRPALVVAPMAPEHRPPAQEVHLRVRSGTEPAPYWALEAERGEAGGSAPPAQVAEGLDTLWLALKGVARNAEAVAHLGGARQARRRAAARGRALWAAAAGVAAVALVCLPRVYSGQEGAPVATPAQGEEPASAAEEALVQPEALPVDVAYPQHALNALGLDLPRRPFPGQRKAPCEEGAEVEIELRDGSRTCWVGIRYSSKVCKTRGYEYKGDCYLPSMPTPREPSSTLPPRTPPAPAQGAAR